MKKALLFAATVSLASVLHAADAPRVASTTSKKPEASTTAAPNKGVLFEPESSTSEGSVTVEGKRIDYKAIAGTIVVHPKGWDDAAWREKSGNDLGDKKDAKAEASMFYVAYFKKGAPSADRPITFLYNGGPGSSTVWLHMGAFGPRRIVTADDSHTAAAPYRIIDNGYSLLDASDLVFIDAPGTGFSRIAGKDKEKAFYGVDPDAHAFGEFIKGFLSQYGRWNSPKYLFGESYGTPRSAVVVNELETGNDIDFNGVVLLSQILNFDLSADTPTLNPGSDEAYVTTLPTYAATAWYHNRLTGERPVDLGAFLKEVEQFANTDYVQALQFGSEIDPARKQQVAEKLAHYTGLPVAYIMKSDLRIDGGQFSKELQNGSGLTTGRLDSRFSGPDMDPLSKEADYDPQSASISSAYVSAFNDYVRKDLRFGANEVYKPEIDVFKDWDFSHQQPGLPFPIRGATNVMPDLASAMKYNPNLKVLVAGGYFDLATPFYEGWYEMHHLPIPAKLRDNIEYHYYPSGHMVYAHQESLKQIHDDVAAFMRRTNNIGG
ncbi:MAG TPA: peptidase S10 [Sphingomonas sp.]|nr:peptidase S10 [Sphingomonas sp.]